MEWCEWTKHSFSISQNLQKIIRISSKITSPKANDKKAFLSDQCKETEENNRMERLEISSRKFRYQGNISCKDGLDKGQKC